MSKIPGGFYLKAKKIQESEVAHWPPHVREIWDWLLMKAFHRDGEKLKRGQLLTSYEEIREGLHWKVGYRKERYSKWDCEKAMKMLTKATMVTTTKTTRGIIITIQNYDYYQNPKNYESHNENHTKATRKPQGTDTIENEVKRRDNERKENTLRNSASQCDTLRDANGTDFYLTHRKRKLTGKRLETFNEFWDAFAYKIDRAKAADAWMDIPELTNALVSKIIEAATRTAKERRELKENGRTPIYAQRWITGRRWEDEHDQEEIEPETEWDRMLREESNREAN